MNTSSPDFVTVDMRGLKAALVARAHQERVSVSVLVRAAVARDLGLTEPDTASRVDTRVSPVSRATTGKLSIRLTPAEGARFAAGARAAALSHGAYLAGLVADVPVLSAGACRPDYLAALVASSAELSTLNRNLHHLSTLLRQGHVRAAQEYREMLDTLAGDVRSHLTLASGVLADLRPRRQCAEPLKHPIT